MKNSQNRSKTETVESDFKYYYHSDVNSLLESQLDCLTDIESAGALLHILYVKQVFNNQFINKRMDDGFDISDLCVDIPVEDTLIESVLGNTFERVIRLLQDEGVLSVREDIHEKGIRYYMFTSNSFLENLPFREITTEIAHDKAQQLWDGINHDIDDVEYASIKSILAPLGDINVDEIQFCEMWDLLCQHRAKVGGTERSPEEFERQRDDAWLMIELWNNSNAIIRMNMFHSFSPERLYYPVMALPTEIILHLIDGRVAQISDFVAQLTHCGRALLRMLRKDWSDYDPWEHEHAYENEMLGICSWDEMDFEKHGSPEPCDMINKRMRKQVDRRLQRAVRRVRELEMEEQERHDDTM